MRKPVLGQARHVLGTLDTVPHQRRAGPIGGTLEVDWILPASAGSALFCSIQPAIAVVNTRSPRGVNIPVDLTGLSLPFSFSFLTCAKMCKCLYFATLLCTRVNPVEPLMSICRNIALHSCESRRTSDEHI